MTRTLNARFDGSVLRLDEPLNLKPNTRVRVTIQTRTDLPQESRGKLRELFGSVDLGYPTGADNERIDGDLAGEYSSTHEEVR